MSVETISMDNLFVIKSILTISGILMDSVETKNIGTMDLDGMMHATQTSP